MSNALNTLDFATLTILAKEIGKAQKEVRKNTEPGTYTAVDSVTFHMGQNCNATVGADYDQRVPLKADIFGLFTTLLGKVNGVTMDSLVREALTADPAEVKAVKAKAQEAWEKINKSTLTHCKGKVTTDKGAEVTVTTGLVVND